MQTGLFANTKLADTNHPAHVAPSRGTDQLAVILEALAKATAEVDEPFVDFFDHERGELGFGGALVFVVGRLSPEFGLLMADLTRAGKHVLGFHVDPWGQDSSTPGLRWHQVRRPVPCADAGADARAGARATGAAEEATSRDAAVA